jgi:hypothetical protein
LALVNLALGGWQTNVRWMSALLLFGHALAPGAGAIAFSDLAGLPSLLSGPVPTLVAVALALLTVSGLIGAVTWRRATRNPAIQPAGAMTALALSGALLITPYIHLNDLLLEALPLLVIAAAPLRWPGKVALVVWAVGVPANLALAILQAHVFHVGRPATPVGFGLILATLAFLAVAEVAYRGPRLGATTHPRGLDLSPS